MSIGWRARLRSLGLAMLILPACYGVSLLGPLGVPSAEGCSGAGTGVSQPSVWATFSIVAHSEVGLPVGTDGFFVLDGYFKGMSAEAAVSTLKVEVKTSDGEPVPGTLKLLDARDDSLLVAWTASSALRVGSSLHAVFHAAQDPSGGETGEVQLEVVGPAPSLLDAPEIVLAGFIDFGHGVGEPVSCGVQVGGSCNSGPVPAQVPSSEERRVAVDVWWRPSGVSAVVAWKVNAVAQSSREGSFPPTSNPYYFFGSGETEVGRLVFANEPEDYCITLVVTDLRTGNESQASKCQVEQEPTAVGADYPLGQCSQTPNQALAPRWCSLRYGPGATECQALQGGTSGATGSPSGVGGSHQADGQSPSRSSKGCYVSGASRPESWSALAPLLGAGLWRARRRARPAAPRLQAHS